MIEEPPLLTIAGQGTRHRPTAAQIAAFANTPTGFVADAMEGVGALDYRIKPLAGVPARFHGPALTCWSGPADILGMLTCLNEITPGDVVLNAVEGWTGCAAIGDRVTAMAKIAGAVGLVTDGLARDQAGIREVGLPVFCAGVSPNSPYGRGPGTVGLPIEIGGLRCESGDMVVGDEDGVVIVPFAKIDAVAARLVRVREVEDQLDAELRETQALPEGIRALVDGEDVRRI